MYKNLPKYIIFALALAVIAVGIAIWFSDSGSPRIFETETVTRNDITQTVFAPGILKAKDQIKVGSLVTGTAKKLYVKENDYVTEGQLLVEVETGRADLDVIEAEAVLLGKEAELEYWTKHFERQNTLHDKGFVSDATVQEALKSYLVAESNLTASRAALDRAKLEFSNTMITAPGQGIITSVGISRGERVTTDLNATVICVISPDVSKMEAKMYVDERDIGLMETGLDVKMYVDAYPEKRFDSILDEVSFSPSKSEGKKMSYEVYAYLNNQELLLHPGMHLTAEIQIASAPNSLSISSRAFLVNKQMIEKAAKLLGYTVEPLKEEKKKEIIKANAQKNVQFVWKKEKGSFTEVPVIVGINNGIHYEIISGLSENDEVVVNILEESELNKI